MFLERGAVNCINICLSSACAFILERRSSAVCLVSSERDQRRRARATEQQRKMEVDSATSKGKRKIRETKGDDGKLKPPLKCMVNLDFEESSLEIWKDAAWRRGGHYQHLGDAPTLLRDLVIWLNSVRDFENATQLKCPDYSTVRAMVGPRWMGRWTPKALLAFQAVANSSGIMHPPRSPSGVSNWRDNALRNRTSVPKWRTHGGEACRRFIQLPPRRKVHHNALPPLQNVNRDPPGSEISDATVQVMGAARTPPATSPARALPFGRVPANRFVSAAAGNDLRFPHFPGVAVGNRASQSAVVSDAPSVASGTSRARPWAPRNSHGGHLARPPPNQVVPHKRVLSSAAANRPPITAGRFPAEVIQLSDSGDSEGNRVNSTAAVAGSFMTANSNSVDSLRGEEEARTSRSTHGSAVRSLAARGDRYAVFFQGEGAHNKRRM